MLFNYIFLPFRCTYCKIITQLWCKFKIDCMVELSSTISIQTQHEIYLQQEFLREGVVAAGVFGIGQKQATAFHLSIHPLPPLCLSLSQFVEELFSLSPGGL